MEKKLTIKLIRELFEKNPLADVSKSISNKSLKAIETEMLSYNQKKAVLGIDIYRYSQYPALPQMLIPHLFKILYDDTIVNCLKHESYIFKSMDKKNSKPILLIPEMADFKFLIILFKL